MESHLNKFYLNIFQDFLHSVTSARKTLVMIASAQLMTLSDRGLLLSLLDFGDLGDLFSDMEIKGTYLSLSYRFSILTLIKRSFFCAKSSTNGDRA